jgi:hypothetical protein
MDNCPQCGASYALVGRVHNCRPREVPQQTHTTATYLYRDPVKRRAQVAANMRSYRARKKLNG